MGALVAAAASIGLAWWLGSERLPATDAALPAVASSPAPRIYAGATPDEAAVQRAYDDVRRSYGEGGASALAQRSRRCSDDLPGRPTDLDYCLALDRFAAAVVRADPGAPEAARFADAEQRDRAWAQLFTPPGAQPQARLAAVKDLAAQVVQASSASSRAGPTPAVRQAPRRAAKPRPRTSGRHAPSPGTCRLASTPSARLLCVEPSLRRADASLTAAYRAALRAGANPRRLAHDQARWRVAVNAAAPDVRAVRRLYAQRTAALRDATVSEGRRR